MRQATVVNTDRDAMLDYDATPRVFWCALTAMSVAMENELGTVAAMSMVGTTTAPVAA